MPKKKKPASSSTTAASEVLQLGTSGTKEAEQKEESDDWLDGDEASLRIQEEAACADQEVANVEEREPGSDLSAEAENPKGAESGLGERGIPKLAIGKIVRNTPEVVYACEFVYIVYTYIANGMVAENCGAFLQAKLP
jgi:hypothetical protein